MPHSYGYRARTRDMFSRGWRQAGTNNMHSYARIIKRGDYVDVFANPSVHKGMPHKFYHGRTGVVFNVTKRAVGVIVNKQVRGNILPKRIHVRVQHVRPSKCRDAYLARVKANEAAKTAAREAGEKYDGAAMKRKPGQPRAGFAVKARKGGRQPVVMYVDAFDPALKL